MKRIQGSGNQGPYSQVVIVGSWVYTSGQIPIEVTTGNVVGETITEQARQTFYNLQGVLAQAGADLTQVVKVTVFLTNLRDFAAFNHVYAEFFPSDRPARSCVQVAALPRDVTVEIEAVAYLG